MTAVFSIGLLEELIEYGIVDSVEKPDQRLHRIEETAKGFPDFLKESATSVVSILEDAYLELHDSTYKETAFLKAIAFRVGKQQRFVFTKGKAIQRLHVPSRRERRDAKV